MLSQFTVLRPLKNKSSETVGRKLWKIICEYGTMKILQSDNGSEFVNEVMSQLTKLFGIDHRLITAYNPRADGLVERTNKDMKRALKKLMGGMEGGWHLMLPVVQLGINDHISSRSGSRPFSLMFNHAFNNFFDFSK